MSNLDLDACWPTAAFRSTTRPLYYWMQAYPELDRRLRPHLRRTTGSWRVD